MLRVRKGLGCIIREGPTFNANRSSTFQPIDRPCLKLLQRNLCRRWQHIEIEAVFVVLLLEFCFGKLPLLVVKISAALGVNSGIVVADHGVAIVAVFLDKFGDAAC